MGRFDSSFLARLLRTLRILRALDNEEERIALKRKIVQPQLNAPVNLGLNEIAEIPNPSPKPSHKPIPNKPPDFSPAQKLAMLEMIVTDLSRAPKFEIEDR